MCQFHFISICHFHFILSIYYLSISLYFNVRLGLSFLVLWQVVKELSKACGKRMKKWSESSRLLQCYCTEIILTKTSGFYHEIQWTLLGLCSSQERQIGQKQNSNWPQQRKEIHWFIKLESPRPPALYQLFQWNSWHGVPSAWWAQGGHLIGWIWEPVGWGSLDPNYRNQEWGRRGFTGKLKRITRSRRKACLSRSVIVVYD